MKNWILIAVLTTLFACDSTEIIRCGFGEPQEAKFVRTGFCPEGYLFELRDGTRIFADYLLMANTHSVPDSALQDLQNGDRVILLFEPYLTDDDPYHLVDIACPALKPAAEYDERIRLLSVEKK